MRVIAGLYTCSSVISCAIAALQADTSRLQLGSAHWISHVTGAQDRVLALGLSRVAGFLLINPMSDSFLVSWDGMAKRVSNSWFLRQVLQFSFPLFILI